MSGFISYITLKTQQNSLKWQHKFLQFQKIMFLYSIQQDSKQFHIKSTLFTVPLSLQED